MSKSKKAGNKKSESAPTSVRLRTKVVASEAAVTEPKTIVLSANQLRALAEAADGTRQTTMYLIEGDDVKHPVKVDKDAGASNVLIEVRTEEKEHFTPVTLQSDPVLNVYYDEDDKPVPFDMSKCDAVFTSLSAVEKFLVPYYAKMKTLDEVIKMRNKFADSTVQAAAFHLPSTYYGVALHEGGVVFAKKEKDTLKGMTFANFIK